VNKLSEIYIRENSITVRNVSTFAWSTQLIDFWISMRDLK